MIDLFEVLETKLSATEPEVQPKIASMYEAAHVEDGLEDWVEVEEVIAPTKPAELRAEVHSPAPAPQPTVLPEEPVVSGGVDVASEPDIEPRRAAHTPPPVERDGLLAPVVEARINDTLEDPEPLSEVPVEVVNGQPRVESPEPRIVEIEKVLEKTVTVQAPPKSRPLVRREALSVAVGETPGIPRPADTAPGAAILENVEPFAGAEVSPPGTAIEADFIVVAERELLETNANVERSEILVEGPLEDRIVRPQIQIRPAAMSAPIASENRETEPADQTVRIQIGRIEIRATPTPQPATRIPRKAPSRPSVNLDEYLARRGSS